MSSIYIYGDFHQPVSSDHHLKTPYLSKKSNIHSAICASGLPQVFNPSRRPWIMTELSETETIIAQVDQCPSGALTWVRNETL